jgi:hypothetical protein
LLVINFFWIETAKTFHHFVGRLVGCDIEERDPGILPLAAGPHISGAPLPKGGSFLNHDPFRSALVS